MNDRERTPRVSVLMPTWNRLAYLPHAVESVLSQSMRDLELVIIDDGSTDDSQAWIHELAAGEPRVHFLTQGHHGISRALNLGLANAHGEWIARLDSDDEWEPQFLEQQLALAESHPEARAIYSRAEAADENLRPKGYFRGSPPVMPGDHLSSLLLGDFTCNITVIARRDDIVSAGGWREQLPHGEDWDLWLRLARIGPFHFNPDVLARYREHGENVTQVNWHDMPEVRAEILRAHFSDPKLPENVQRWRGTAFRRQHVNGAMAALSTGRWNCGMRRLWQAFREGDGWIKTAGYAGISFLSWCVLPRVPWLRSLQKSLLEFRNRRRASRAASPRSSTAN